MIETYNANRELNIKDGKATVSFGFSVENLSPESARHVEKEIDAFIVRVTAPERPAPMNHDGGTKWSDDEKATVRPCTTADEAWKKYNAAFPDSPRSRKTVIRWWMDYGNKPEDKSTDGLPSTRSPDIPDQDKTGCEECDNIGGPSGTKDPDKCDACSPPVKKKPAIKPPRALKKPANHMGNGKWSTEEIKAVSGHKDRETAIEAYRVAFPNSPRNDNAIGMKWYALDRKAREEAKKEAKERKKSNAKVQKAEENVAVPGPAVGQEYSVDTDSGETAFESSGTPDPEPPAEDTTNPSRDEPPSEDTPPAEDPPADDGRYKVGDLVRQTSGSAIFTGTGKIKRAPPDREEVLVQFDNGMNWIHPNHLSKARA